MAQQAWNVRGNRGHRFQVGLFHGDKDGHVMLYCNAKVVQVDFNVAESKQYSLLLDDEICIVGINKESDGSFSYTCELDRESETPLNLKRKAEKELIAKQDNLRLYVAAGIVLVVGLLWVWLA